MNLEQQRRKKMTKPTLAQSDQQYSLAKILGIFAAVTVPYFVMAWVVFPAITPDYETDPMGAGYARMGTLTVALIWEFALAMIIVYREEGNLRWGTLQRRLRLDTPQDPTTGRPRRKLWLWLIPIVLLHTVGAMMILPAVDHWVSDLIPFIAPPPGYELGSFLQSPEAGPLFLGNWGILGLFLIMITFNILGEELLWRGVLLPKMNGVFGKWDWLANGLLGTLYHVSMPWSWFGTTGINWIFFYALPAKYFRSTWFSIIVHGSIMVLETILILGLVMGFMQF
jgi:membrane protease YdiL (CAAX protease family)